MNFYFFFFFNQWAVSTLGRIFTILSGLGIFHISGNSEVCFTAFYVIISGALCYLTLTAHLRARMVAASQYPEIHSGRYSSPAPGRNHLSFLKVRCPKSRNQWEIQHPCGKQTLPWGSAAWPEVPDAVRPGKKGAKLSVRLQVIGLSVFLSVCSEGSCSKYSFVWHGLKTQKNSRLIIIVTEITHSFQLHSGLLMI